MNKKKNRNECAADYITFETKNPIKSMNLYYGHFPQNVCGPHHLNYVSNMGASESAKPNAIRPKLLRHSNLARQ